MERPCPIVAEYAISEMKIRYSQKNKNSMKKFSDDGIPTKQSPLEVSESSDVVITMLPSSSHVSRLHVTPILDFTA